jgi:hypothetical protein
MEIDRKYSYKVSCETFFMITFKTLAMEQYFEVMCDNFCVDGV